jgi:hypothetical protein
MRPETVGAQSKSNPAPKGRIQGETGGTRRFGGVTAPAQRNRPGTLPAPPSMPGLLLGFAYSLWLVLLAGVL